MLVQILHLDAATLEALAVGDLEAANQTAPVPLGPIFVDEEWREVWAIRADQVLAIPADQPWVTGVTWDPTLEVAVGRAGFHAAPDVAGMVEVGYTTDPTYRRRGYARAALQAMVDRARLDPSVRVLRASISPDNEASLALVDAFGLSRNGEQWDEDDGLEWIFELNVSQ